MKLTKAQENVINKMEEGWNLSCEWSENSSFLEKDNEYITVGIRTLRALLKKNVIVKLQNGFCVEHYKLS